MENTNKTIAYCLTKQGMEDTLNTLKVVIKKTEKLHKQDLRKVTCKSDYVSCKQEYYKKIIALTNLYNELRGYNSCKGINKELLPAKLLTEVLNEIFALLISELKMKLEKIPKSEDAHTTAQLRVWEYEECNIQLVDFLTLKK